ncbi:hypothetical protein GCM10010313_01720 [Streptomyces violarus]|nr:hypothetical protein GCM10010313_01720 [Streptomyces violarus]
MAGAGRNEILLWRLARPRAPVFRHALAEEYEDAGGVAVDMSPRAIRYIGSRAGTRPVVHTLDPGRSITSSWQPLVIAAVQNKTAVVADHVPLPPIDLLPAAPPARRPADGLGCLDGLLVHDHRGGLGRLARVPHDSESDAAAQLVTDETEDAGGGPHH